MSARCWNRSPPFAAPEPTSSLRTSPAMPRAYSTERAAGACALLCLIVSVLLLGKPSFSDASLPVQGIVDPVIALQASRSITDIDYVLGEAPGPDREAMRVKQYVGFAFIAAYTA